ncbi:hypothetical protein CE91St60_05200 [[Clostridium] scindens]|nr:hypothetical protein CE91St60_05200 [[Clostridium] scindens]
MKKCHVMSEVTTNWRRRWDQSQKNGQIDMRIFLDIFAEIIQNDRVNDYDVLCRKKQ